VETSLVEPNGIAISPDQSTLYISDTGAITSIISPTVPPIGATFNSTGQRFIYKYDICDDGNLLANKRAIYLAPAGVPDGLKVAKNGLIVTGAGNGVDVLDDVGNLVVRVQTNFTVQNFAWVTDKRVNGGTGKLTEFWLMGNGGIGRVRWNLEGQNLK
jgi:sugar lactone lactonase YvrE